MSIEMSFKSEKRAQDCIEIIFNCILTILQKVYQNFLYDM